MKTINYLLGLVFLLILRSCTQPTSSIVSEVLLDSIQQSYETIIVYEQKPFALPTFIEQNISPYYHYSSVPWKEIKQTYYRPYSADWGDEIESMMEDSFPVDIACDMWAKLQNAKCKFHQDNLPLRAICDAQTIDMLNETESCFDSVFIHCVTQEYYMRLFVDCYQEIMPYQIDRLVEHIRLKE